MGYSATYKINEELDGRFKPLYKTFNKHSLEKSKTILVGTCLIARDINTYSLGKLYDEIYTCVKMYTMDLRDEWCHDLQERLKDTNEIQVCGWEFTRDKTGFVDIDDFDRYTTESLFYIALNPTDFNDLDKYHEKIHQINEQLSDAEWCIHDIMERDLFDTYAKKEGSEFEDGY